MLLGDGVFGSVATSLPSEPLHAARTGQPDADRRDAGEGAAVEEGLGTVGHAGNRTDRERPTPLSRGPRTTLTADPQRSPQADLRVAFLAAGRFAGAFAAFLAGAFAAGALRARRTGLGCSASRPSSNGFRNWPV